MLATVGILQVHDAATEPLAASPQAEPLYAVPTRTDRAGRILAPVMVNGKGPFRFIVDTGANRSVLSPAVAAALGLTPSLETAIGVHGVTGSAVLPAVQVRLVEAGNIVLARNTRMPVLPENVLADADGILGIEGLGSARIEIDFVEDRVSIRRSTGQGLEDGALAIPAVLRHGGLLLANARVGKVRTKVIIDTGAERSLGNAALRDSLGLGPGRGETSVVTTVFGATPALGDGTSFRAPRILLGEAALDDLEVTFADLHVFKLWGMEKEPAMLVGMDLLGTVRRLVIDYRRREIQLVP